jgi:hypothetical protein
MRFISENLIMSISELETKYLNIAASFENANERNLTAMTHHSPLVLNTKTLDECTLARCMSVREPSQIPNWIATSSKTFRIKE